MIKKLRYRFLLATTLALFIVLAVIIGALNIANYYNTVKEADTVLDILASNKGEFPNRGNAGQFDEGFEGPDGFKDSNNLGSFHDGGSNERSSGFYSDALSVNDAIISVAANNTFRMVSMPVSTVVYLSQVQQENMPAPSGGNPSVNNSPSSNRNSDSIAGEVFNQDSATHGDVGNSGEIQPDNPAKPNDMKDGGTTVPYTYPGGINGSVGTAPSDGAAPDGAASDGAAPDETAPIDNVSPADPPHNNIPDPGGVGIPPDMPLDGDFGNNGRFDDGRNPSFVTPAPPSGGSGEVPSASDDSGESNADESNDAQTDNHNGFGRGLSAQRSAELPYESRYFSVLFDADGAVISSSTRRIAAIDEETAIAYAKSVWNKGKERGFFSNYRYLRSPEDSNIRIIFLDCGRMLDSFRSVLLVSTVSSLLGLLAVFILIFIFSSRIIRPISESYEKQRRFITDAGHEIKTPLTIIDADATVLEMEIGESEWLSDIRAQTKRLSSLTNDLIFLSRVEEPQSAAPMIEFPLSDVLQECAESFQTLAKAQNKTFTIDVEPMLSMTGDQKNIRQLLSVLLDNALKYSQEGGYVTVTAHSASKGITLTVENSCEHIDKDKLPRLFDRFYRAEESHNSQTGGYGIGLSIAKAIVTTHKGKITAVSPDEKSLKITAVFPQKTPQR